MLKNIYKYIKNNWHSTLIISFLTFAVMHYFKNGVEAFFTWFFLIAIKELITNIFHNQTFVSACSAGAIYLGSHIGLEVLKKFKKPSKDKNNVK